MGVTDPLWAAVDDFWMGKLQAPIPHSTRHWPTAPPRAFPRSR